MYPTKNLQSAFKQFRSFSKESLRVLCETSENSVFKSSLPSASLRLSAVSRCVPIIHRGFFLIGVLIFLPLSLQAGFSFTPLPLNYDCAYLTLPMALNATTFDCDSGSTCSITMSVRVSVHDSALNEIYAWPLTYNHPCDLVPTLTYTFTWPPGWFVYNGLIEGNTYWVQLEMLSFTASTAATETYLLGNNLKITLEGPATYAQPKILTTQSFVYSPMTADFSWQEIKSSGLQAKKNTVIELESTSTIFGNVDYRWYLDGKLIGTDSALTYSAPCHQHEIKLEVEQVPGGCVSEIKQMIPAGLGCVSPLRESNGPFLPSVIGRGEQMELPEIAGRKYELIGLSGKALPLDTRRLTAGIYYLKIEEGREVRIHKFLVQ